MVVFIQIPIHGDPYFIMVPTASTEDGSPSATTRYMSFSPSLTHNLTLHPDILQQVKELGIGKNAKDFIAFAIVSQSAVVALEDLSPFNDGEEFKVTVDAHR